MLDELDLQQVSADILRELIHAKRPVLIFGAGVRKSADEAREVAKALGIPVCPTWGARDLFPACVGSFGTHGVKAANYAVQNADYILCIGSRLDTKATGSPASSFAPNARIVMVDIDDRELAKMGKIGVKLYRSIRADARDFLRHFLPWVRAYLEQNNGGVYTGPWRAAIEGHAVDLDGAQYEIVRDLGLHISADDVIVSDTGCALAWMMQAYPFKGETFIHAFNQTPMGYGLPAAIGAAFATGKTVFLITGDGGLSLCMNEMATVAHHKLPIKIVLFENRAHAMCMSTQRQWFDGEYVSTSEAGGLAFPNFISVAAAYGLEVVTSLEALAASSGPSFCSLKIDPMLDVQGQVKYGEAIA